MQKKRFRFFILLLSVFLLHSGCAPIMEKIQETTGSELKKIDKLAVTEFEGGADERTAREVKVTKSPAPHTDLEKILEDQGRGEYSGSRYDQDKVIKALNLMPKGLADDKAYAYLLGLVGENYRDDVETFYRMEKVEYETKFQAWYQRKDTWIKPQLPNTVETAQTKENEANKKVNFVVLMDASGSMKGEINGKTKLDWVEQTLQEFAKKLPQDTTHFQLRVFGHQGSNREEDKDFSCSRVDKIYSSAKLDEEKLKAALDQVDPTGYTPLALAIHTSRQDLLPGKPQEVENQLIIISDGYENCGGNPVRSAELLQKSGSLSGIHVIGLEVGRDSEEELRGIADLTGGEYATVYDEKELKSVLFERINGLNLIKEPWEIRALHAITQAHRYDSLRLSRFAHEMSQKVQKEHERLGQANDYVKNKGKIDHDTWAEIDTWISKRKKQLDQYVQNRQHQIETRLDYKYLIEINKLEKAWQADGGKPDEINNRAKAYLKQEKKNNSHFKQKVVVPVQE